MDGNDFIALAGKLAASPAAAEATYRTAISRAYYGAFHIARSLLVELGFAPVGNANVHGFVQQYLQGSKNPHALRAASLLSHLQAERNRADYRLEDNRFSSQRDAMLLVERAHLAVAALERCRAPDARESILQAISEYQKKTYPK
jgi:uncharacterized protein (UPF0332 family)